MKLSVVSSVLVNYSMRDAILQVAEAGVEGINIWAGRPHVYRNDHSQAELRDLRKVAEDHHLEIPSVLPAFFRYPHSLSNPNEIVRQDSLSYMRQSMENAVTLGAKILLIVPGRTLHGQTLQDARQRLTDSIDELCRAANSYDIQLGIEPANNSVTDLVLTSEDALNIINALGHRNLGVVMDTGHLNLTGETAAQAMERLGKLLLQFHVNDNDGKRQQNHIPGNGTYDFAGLTKLLRAANYDGYLSVELGFDYTLNPAPAIQESVKRMRAAIQEAN